MSVAELQNKVNAAKAAYKANKEDKSLKTAYKALKAELEAAQAAAASGSKKRKAEDEPVEEETASKKTKVDVEALKAAATEAKKAYKANKGDASLKAAYKAAKKAVEDAEAAPAAAEEPATEEAAPAAEDALAGLKKNNAPAASNNSSDKAPSTKLFCGNISFKLQDDDIKEFFKDCGELIDIHWLTNRDTQQFKGCGFVEFATQEEATKAFNKNGQMLLEREIKIDYATPRPNAGGNKGGKGKFAPKPLSEKPEGCTTVFAGNLSFQIDEDQMHEFAKDCGEIKGIRWLTDRESGDFKGCGFIEFFDTDSVDKFVKKNGEDLLGRSIRLDYSAPRKPRNF